MLVALECNPVTLLGDGHRSGTGDSTGKLISGILQSNLDITCLINLSCIRSHPMGSGAGWWQQISVIGYARLLRHKHMINDVRREAGPVNPSASCIQGCNFRIRKDFVGKPNLGNLPMEPEGQRALSGVASDNDLAVVPIDRIRACRCRHRDTVDQ